jgi:hypothetical protein
MLRIRSASLIGFFQRLLLSFVFPRRGTSIVPIRCLLDKQNVGDAIGPSVARYEP